MFLSNWLVLLPMILTANWTDFTKEIFVHIKHNQLCSSSRAQC